MSVRSVEGGTSSQSAEALRAVQRQERKQGRDEVKLVEKSGEAARAVRDPDGHRGNRVDLYA